MDNNKQKQELDKVTRDHQASSEKLMELVWEAYMLHPDRFNFPRFFGFLQGSMRGTENRTINAIDISDAMSSAMGK